MNKNRIQPKKKGSLAVFVNMVDLEAIMLSERNQTQKGNSV